MCKKLLNLLDKNNLNIHAIIEGEHLPIPLAIQCASTHYIMLDDKIVFCGNLPELTKWVYNFNGQQQTQQSTETASCA